MARGMTQSSAGSTRPRAPRGTPHLPRLGPRPDALPRCRCRWTIDGTPVPSGTPKQRAVLAMLVINRNRPVGSATVEKRLDFGLLGPLQMDYRRHPGAIGHPQATGCASHVGHQPQQARRAYPTRHPGCTPGRQGHDTATDTGTCWAASAINGGGANCGNDAQPRLRCWRTRLDIPGALRVAKATTPPPTPALVGRPRRSTAPGRRRRSHAALGRTSLGALAFRALAPRLGLAWCQTPVRRACKVRTRTVSRGGGDAPMQR